MSIKYLGEQIDIHGGGWDVVFPHHENEIAQSECYTGKKPFVKYWMHNGLLQLGAEKMSKSLGNLITIRDALKRYTPDALRIFVLSSYYRSPLTYTDEAIDAAAKGADRLSAAARGEGKGKAGTVDAGPYRQRFIEAMDDDFNTSQAIAAMFDLSREINRADETGADAGPARETLKEMGGVLGLTFKVAEETAGNAAPFIELLISTRNGLRKAKQFQLADEIRNKLVELGIVLEDTAQGTAWKRKR
jgi:cysteinyl-tRNA synthetase